DNAMKAVPGPRAPRRGWHALLCRINTSLMHNNASAPTAAVAGPHGVRQPALTRGPARADQERPSARVAATLAAPGREGPCTQMSSSSAPDWRAWWRRRSLPRRAPGDPARAGARGLARRTGVLVLRRPVLGGLTRAATLAHPRF